MLVGPLASGRSLRVSFHAVFVRGNERVLRVNTAYHLAAHVPGGARALHPPPPAGLRRAARTPLVPRREVRALRAARAGARRRGSGTAAGVGGGAWYAASWSSRSPTA